MEEKKEEEISVKFVDLSNAAQKLYREFRLAWVDIYNNIKDRQEFGGACGVGFAEDIRSVFVYCSGDLLKYESLIRDYIENLISNAGDDINYSKIAIDAAKYAASLVSANSVNIYDVSEYESAYIIAIPIS